MQSQTVRPNAEFIALIAMMTAMIAMSIDTMLPAIGIIARELGAVHDNDRQLIILGFFGGMMFGTLIFGPLSDSIGRKPAIYIGLMLYTLGSLVCLFSTSFEMLVAGRVLQGFGGASPRVVSLAMVRDGAAGAAMARIMSFVMSVFMLVPILAPAVGQGVLIIADWRWIFVGFIVWGITAGLWLGTRQPETLTLEKRLPFTAETMWRSAVEVVRNPISIGYTVAVGGIFGAFVTYLGTSQQIFADQYDQGAYFALWFGGLAVAIALAMIFNGKSVMRFGMRRMSQRALWGFIASAAGLVLASLLAAGHPPLWVLGTLFFVNFFCSGMIFGNYNAMAMEPMGHIAGMASAISGALSSLLALTLGGVAGRLYDGSLNPVAGAFLAYGLVALFFSEWAERNRPQTTLNT
jgi:DHA1 family bicyclomycin/chloramphenicol resistance-like MFS transporter